MRMKEICERTGLTDRAVRLYIDNGLLNPSEEHGYSGRRSIHFSEEDVVTLETISTLRKADFSIADIKEMQTEPEQIPTILDAHKKKLTVDIETKQRILDSLTEINGSDSIDCAYLAAFIQQSASRNHLPKEDSNMRFKDFQRIIKSRIFSILALVLLLVGTAVLAPLLIRAAFSERDGWYTFTYVYTFSWASLFSHIQLFAAWLGMAAAVVLLFAHMISGKRTYLLGTGILCVLAIAAMLLLPEEIRQSLYLEEFWSFRHSFWAQTPLYVGPKSAPFIKSLKFIPPVIAAVVSFVGYFKQEDMTAEDMQ